MFSLNDTLHFRELVSKQCNLKTFYAPSTDDSCPLPPKSHIIKSKPRLLACCGSTSNSYHEAITHWIQEHRTQPSLNPLIQQASNFLRSFKTLPSNPRYFRPKPASTSPLEMRNPYSAAQAMAYDFLDQINTTEYAFFSRICTPNSKSTYLDIWPLWASYFYFSHNKPKSAAPFPCKLCPKAFNQRHGLKYHMNAKHSTVKPEPFRLFTHKPTFKCPIESCKARFTYSGAIPRHIVRKHQQLSTDDDPGFLSSSPPSQ
ncbi:Zinc finger E-box-binding homeobox 2 [Entomophthora muscae]|uniref:Zinc finger E-box-binding homeobox 2 n=1 Tax=Entomophthora muscae TaxID=34485 RepID=A0ACC2SSZ7_9FUNG|nr:Zinc finger E-box-binding homeobox 2 [Entomophthora muscae]